MHCRHKKTGTPLKRLRFRLCGIGLLLDVVVQEKLVRMGSQTKCIHFLRPLVIDPHLNGVRGEYISLEEEAVVFFEVVERLVKRTRHGRHIGQFFRRHIVDVLVERFAWIDFVLDAVEARHQHGREREIGVAAQGRGTGPQCVWPWGSGCTSGCGRKPNGFAGVGQVHRSFKARRQAFVAVRRRVGEGRDRLCVFEDAADILQCHLRHAGILVAGEQGFAPLPDGLVGVHARPVVTEKGLGHEGRGLVVPLGHVLDDVLVHT